MAYIVASEKTLSDGNQASIDISVPSGHQADDYHVIVASQDGGATTIAASGYTDAFTQAQVQGQRTAVLYKKLTGSSEPDAIVTGSNDGGIFASYLMRGADTTTFVNVAARSDSADSSSDSLTLSGVTTTANNCLVLWGAGFDNSRKWIVQETNTCVTLNKDTNVDISQLSGYFNQYASGATQNLTMLSEVSSEGGNGFMVAINDANPSSPSMMPHPTRTYDVLHRYGGVPGVAAGIPAFTRHDDITWLEASANIIPSTINSITVGTITSPTQVDTAPTDSVWGSSTSLRTSDSGVDSTGLWFGYSIDISTVDFTGKIFSVEFNYASIGASVRGREGMLVYFDDGTNWAAFQLSQLRSMTAGTTYVGFVDVENFTPYASSGTIDWSAVTQIAYLMHRVGTNTTSQDFRVKNALLHEGVILTGGSVGSPVSATTLIEVIGNDFPLINGHGAYLLSEGRISAGQAIAKTGIQLGNGTNKTYVNLSGISHALPPVPGTSINNRFWKVENEMPSASYRIVASANDTYRMVSTIIRTDTEQDFIIDATSSADAEYDFTAASIIGYNVAVNADVTINNATLRNCSIDLADGGLSGCTIREQRGAVKTSDPEKLVNNDFASPGSGHAIEADTPGTYDFNGNSFTGYGADGSTDAAFYNNSGGAIELVIPVGDDTPTVRNGAGASTTITQPTENQKVTLTNLIIGSRVQIYDLTADTELLNIVADATTEIWEDSNPYVADREIRIRIAYVDGTDAKQFIENNIGTLTSSDPQVTFRVNQVDDDVYIANAIDGSTVTDITIDDGNMLLELNSATETWQRMYAYEMYWLFTETGIQDLGQSITAPDTANYLMDSNVLVIKNISGSPTVITGGWGRDRTTGSTLDIIDITGDPIFTNPEHVVAFAVGSGVTPQDKSDIIDGVVNELEPPIEEVLSNTDATQAKVNQL